MIISGREATTVIPPNFKFRIDQLGNIIATRQPSSAPKPRKETTTALAAAVV